MRKDIGMGIKHHTGADKVSLLENGRQVSASGSPQRTKARGSIAVILASRGSANNSQKICAVTEISSGLWTGIKALSPNSTKVTNGDMLPQWQTKT